MRAFALVYGSACYLVFAQVIVYLFFFLLGSHVPKGINDGIRRPLFEALAIDVGLIILFGLQHSVMARQRFKRWWTRFIPTALERSTYVLFSSFALAILVAYWAPLPQVVWELQAGWLTSLMWALFGTGWVVLLLSTFLIDHRELFGLRQVWSYFRGRVLREEGFKTPSLYRIVRHPMMFGLLLVFWARPRMTLGNLVLSAGFSAYIVLGTLLEEQDLLCRFGRAYADYRLRVPMLIPGAKGSTPDQG